MSQALTQEQELLQGTVRDFSREEISRLAPKIDSDSMIPDSIFKRLPELGLYGISVPAEFGGAGADYLSFLISVEELSRVSGTVGARISFHGVVCETLKASQNVSLRASVLPKLASGSLSALSIDPKSTIRWKKAGDGGYLLDGSAEYVMNADLAEFFLVVARSRDETSIIFCIEKQSAGKSFEVSEPKKLMGMRGSGTSKISLHELKLSDSSIVFDSDSVKTGINTILIAARLAVSSQALGIGQASLDEEIRYANERTQFNTKIGRFYAVQDFIASDEVSIDSARSLTYSVASQPLSLESADRKSGAAKIAASNAAVQSARHSIRVHGGYGFVRDYPVERYLRDARATQIYLEPNEVLKAKIAEDLLR